jgi:hypothetical protein
MNPVLDHFDDADGSAPPSAQWIASTPGSYSVEGGHLVGPHDGTVILWGTEFGPDQEAYATFSNFDDNLYDMRLVLKAQHTNGAKCDDAIFLNVSAMLNDAYVAYCIGDAPYPLAFHGIRIHKGMVVGARVFANGCIDVYADGQWLFMDQIPSVDMPGAPAPPWLAQGGRIGVYGDPTQAGGGVLSEWDDFGGGP